MSGILSHVDHPVIAVADLDEARHSYLRLGFTIPPKGSHLEWGTGNWCIMFGRDYLELRGIVDPARYTHHLATRLAERGEGLMGVAFAPRKSAAESYKDGVAAGLSIELPISLTRHFALPEGAAFPSFSIAAVDPGDLAVLENVVICEHRTPDIIRRPDWLVHPNGALGVRMVAGIAPDLGLVADDFVRYLGPDAVSQNPDRVVARPPEGATIEIAASVGRDISALTLLEIDVVDIAQARNVLTSNGVDFKAVAPNMLEVESCWAHGACLRFVEAGA